MSWFKDSQAGELAFTYRFNCVQLLQPHGLWPTRFFCLWDSPDKNTGAISDSDLRIPAELGQESQASYSVEK